MKKIKITKKYIYNLIASGLSYVIVLPLHLFIKIFEWLDSAFPKKCPKCGHRMFQYKMDRYDCSNCEYQEYIEI